uniref:Uncharacterized protein n=1 Tax=Siphoviridae sp. ctrpM6 TaxID=2827956 RepID=A0A8S5T5H0_9CAUD|nr:MAG TPA: hypothetical protein [Siphoviridae sp. ctrpM6]
MNTIFDFLQLSIRDICITLAVLAHQSIINAHESSKSTHIYHLIILKERRQIKLVVWDIRESLRNLITQLTFCICHTCHRLQKVFFCSSYRITCADNSTATHICIICNIAAILLFLNRNLKFFIHTKSILMFCYILV